MRKLVLATLALGLMALSTGGCIQMHMVTDINDDGSGTAEMKLSISAVVMESMAEMKELGMDQGQGMDMPDFDNINREDLEKNGKKYGVKVLEFEKSEIEGRPTIAMKLAFEDLKGLSYVMNSTMGGSSEDGMGIFATEDGNFVLKSAEYDFPAKPAEMAGAEGPVESAADEPTAPEAPDPEMMQKQMAIMGKMMGAMAEMDVSMKITVPGDIIESNAPTVEGRTSIWKIDSSNMMTAGADMEPNIVFSGEGLKIKGLEE